MKTNEHIYTKNMKLFTCFLFKNVFQFTYNLFLFGKDCFH